MNSEALKETAKKLMGQFISDDFPFEDVTKKLQSFETENAITLSPYGYIMWAVDHHGFKCAYKNLMASEPVINGFAIESLRARDDMPALLVNAHMYVSRIMANVADLETCFKQLEGMTFPHVLYVLFAASGQADVVEKYRKQTKEHLKRYPSALDLLPDSYKSVGRNLCNADAK